MFPGHLRFKLISELVDDGAYRPVGPVRQAADRGAGHRPHRACQFKQQVEVSAGAVALFDACEDFVHPAGALPAGRALAA